MRTLKSSYAVWNAVSEFNVQCCELTWIYLLNLPKNWTCELWLKQSTKIESTLFSDFLNKRFSARVDPNIGLKNKRGKCDWKVSSRKDLGNKLLVLCFLEAILFCSQLLVQISKERMGAAEMCVFLPS